ncbi:MAG: hypothetical protein MZV49_10695 [Rhodopseudomonas palustris]|nr:hypothetical protein [Rhodopseudomonas palustris]
MPRRRHRDSVKFRRHGRRSQATEFEPPAGTAAGARRGHAPQGAPPGQRDAPGGDRLAARVAAAGAARGRLGPRRPRARGRRAGRAERGSRART